MEKKAAEIARLLEKDYPEAYCSLIYEHDYELLFATRLAAQCTDERVNIVTKDLFVKYPTLEAFAKADISEMEQDIHSCGFFRTKARDIILCANILISDFGGKVPDNMDDLLKLPGVGRKTANLILGDIFKKPAVVVDTHCIRLTNLLGLCKTKDPVKIEMQLKKLLAPELQSDFCHRLVIHGRAVCTARHPMCEKCSLAPLCSHFLGILSQK